MGSFDPFSDASKLVMIVLMWLGRLEIIPVAVLLSAIAGGLRARQAEVQVLHCGNARKARLDVAVQDLTQQAEGPWVERVPY